MPPSPCGSDRYCSMSTNHSADRARPIIRPAMPCPRRACARVGTELLLCDLHSSRRGLSTAEAQRRLLQYGRNELRRRGTRRWPGEPGRHSPIRSPGCCRSQRRCY
ncbi:cation-transporting P-type ATPase [Nonomuraea sp. NPDC049400]|uniref:cation-transporting P-type ATPase n=1 Tax=Nonomuraea sp. NPDC049400 TaxID=3364352 RepID=UPI00379AFDFB